MPKLPALPFARSAVTQGLSANQAYANYRQAAGEVGARGMRRQDFLRLYSETRAMRADLAEAMDRPKNLVPSSDQINTRTSEYQTGFIQSVIIYQRTRGEQDLIETPFMIKTNRPITPGEAEQRAQWYLEQEEPDVYNRVTLGVAYTGTVELQLRAR